MLVGYAVKLAAITGLYAYMFFDNKKRDRETSVEVYGEDVVKEGIEKGMMVSFPYFFTCEMCTDSCRTKRSSRTGRLDMCYDLLSTSILLKVIKSFLIVSCYMVSN